MARVTAVPDPAAAAAALLAARLADLDRRRGAVRLAVAGGSALAVLGVLRQALDPGVWRRLLLTWADERCVPQADPASNRGTAYRDGRLDPARPPALELPLFLDRETPAGACERVAAGLAGPFRGGLDALLLGLGEDGHIASLFPGRPWASAPDVFPVLDSPKPPPRRITLALPLLASAQVAVLVAAGEAKRAALTRLAGGDPALAASALGGLEVVTDLDLSVTATGRGASKDQAYPGKDPMNFFDLPLKALDGRDLPLSEFRGKVVLAVNVASECGYTPQYEGLQKLHAAFAPKGFSVIGFPCDQFGGQEPGSPEAIRAFCSTRYQVTFPLSEKLEVKGPGQAPVFAFLASQSGEPKWNFAKYLVGRDGQVLQAFPSSVAPESPELVGAIEAALGG